MKKRTLFTPRQIEVLRLRRTGMTQDQVADVLGTSRENVSIIERNAFRTMKAARSTLEAFESLDGGSTITIPERTPIFDVPRMILVRGDVLGVRLRTTEDEIISLARSKGRIRGHHLMSPMTVEVRSDGTLLWLPPESFTRGTERRLDAASDVFGDLAPPLEAPASPGSASQGHRKSVRK